MLHSCPTPYFVKPIAVDRGGTLSLSVEDFLRRPFPLTTLEIDHQIIQHLMAESCVPKDDYGRLALNFYAILSTEKLLNKDYSIQETPFVFPQGAEHITANQ